MIEKNRFKVLQGHPYSAASDAAIQLRINEEFAILNSLKLNLSNKTREEQDLINECEEWLSFATEKLGKASLAELPFGFDAAYAALHKIRHHLCTLLPREQLYRVAMQIESDFDYVGDGGKREILQSRLEELKPYLDPATPISSAGKLTEAQVRHELKQMSIVVAESRETVWRKVNLLRTRLFTTLAGLAILLALSIPIAHYALQPQLKWYHILAIQLLGAIGGAISALRTQEELNLRTTQYYLKQTVLYLRPAVGAAAGFALALVQLSGAVSILPDAGEQYKVPLVLLVAFLGGFSERLFLGRMDKLVGESREAGKTEIKKEAPTKPAEPESVGSPTPTRDEQAGKVSSWH